MAEAMAGVEEVREEAEVVVRVVATLELAVDLEAVQVVVAPGVMQVVVVQRVGAEALLQELVQAVLLRIVVPARTQVQQA